MDHSCVLLQKNETFSRSFPFFSRKERNVLLVLISHQKLEKRTERTKQKRTLCPTLPLSAHMRGQ